MNGWNLQTIQVGQCSIEYFFWVKFSKKIVVNVKETI